MLQAPQGEHLVAFHAVVTRFETGAVEDLGLIDHSHAWLFTEAELRALAHSAAHLEDLLRLRKSGEPGATIIPAGLAIAEGKSIFANQAGGQTSAPPQYIGFGQGTALAGTRVTALTTDGGLAGEIAAPSGTNTNTGQSARVTGAVTNITTTNIGDTMKVVGTLTAGAALAIVEAGLFTTSAFPGETTVATVTSTFLAGTTTGGGTATVASSTGLPTASSYYQVDQEVMQCSLSGTTLTSVSRGQNGSSAAAHAAGCALVVVTAGGTGGGGLCAAKGDFAVINLASADTLALTATVQFT